MKQIQWFSKETNRLYQLFGEPPTLKISGVPMHRHIKMNPIEDTELKIRAARPRGVVLDVCTGLGYTAICAARLSAVKKVITIEKDKNVLEIAKQNPYSSELFSSKKIEIINADAFERIKSFENASFDTIIHDPPTYVMATELYSEKFYTELFRVLKTNCRIWHYLPEPGRFPRLREKVMKGLKNAGFRSIFYDESSSGILAVK